MGRTIIAAAFVAAAACSAPASRAHHLDIRGLQFDSVTTVAVGDTIVWTNRDAVPHTVSASAWSWGSGNLDRGETHAWIVKRPGVVEYVCAYHPTMTGKIVTNDLDN